MTDQEAQRFEERLTRIWGTLNGVPWYAEDGYLVGALNAQNTLSVTVHQSRVFLTQVNEGRLILARIHYNKATGEISGNPFRTIPPAFAAQWMNFFRRGCWLSGCLIEASAHEKVEWMQGFSKEEIEAWNLKM